VTLVLIFSQKLAGELLTIIAQAKLNHLDTLAVNPYDGECHGEIVSGLFFVARIALHGDLLV